MNLNFVVIPYQNAGFHNAYGLKTDLVEVVIPYQNAGFHNCALVHDECLWVVIPYQNAGFHNGWVTLESSEGL